MQISAVILTKNSSRSLKETLQALKDFQEIIVLDHASDDGTKEIASSFTDVKFFESSFDGFGKEHNKGAKLAKFDWILSVDSDEVLSPQLAEEIKALPLDNDTVYSIPFWNFYRGKRVKCCGWDKEEHIRLYNRQKTSFNEAQVHEGVNFQGLRVIKLKNPILHTSYRNTEDFLRKMQVYTTLFAKDMQGRVDSSFSKALLHGISAFLKCYILKRGFLGGSIGFIISLYNANTAFYKYQKLAEANEEISKK